MNPPSNENDRFQVIAPGTRATAVIVHEVPDERGPEFMDWQKSIALVVRQLPGYERTEVYPPEPGTSRRWVTLLHFQSNQHLEVWLQSPERARSLAQFREAFGSFTLRHLGRFDAWFTDGLDPKRVPGWKMVCTVLAALYPTVMGLLVALGPFLQGLNASARMLVSNAVSVALLQWVMMPIVTLALAFWLKPDATRARTLAGGAAVALYLAVWLAFFSWLVG